jgi:hypothetical protein
MNELLQSDPHNPRGASHPVLLQRLQVQLVAEVQPGCNF